MQKTRGEGKGHALDLRMRKTDGEVDEHGEAGVAQRKRPEAAAHTGDGELELVLNRRRGRACAWRWCS
jgi:hypothetical protein